MSKKRRRVAQTAERLTLDQQVGSSTLPPSLPDRMKALEKTFTERDPNWTPPPQPIVMPLWWWEITGDLCCFRDDLGPSSSGKTSGVEDVDHSVYC